MRFFDKWNINNVSGGKKTCLTRQNPETNNVQTIGKPTSTKPKRTKRLGIF